MREQRLRRIREIRQTVVAIAICAFIVLFSAIYIQMASGDDPALGSAVQQTLTSASEPEETDDAQDDSGVASFTPAPVTSGQS